MDHLSWETNCLIPKIWLSSTSSVWKSCSYLYFTIKLSLTVCRIYFCGLSLDVLLGTTFWLTSSDLWMIINTRWLLVWCVGSCASTAGAAAWPPYTTALSWPTLLGSSLWQIYYTAPSFHKQHARQMSCLFVTKQEVAMIFSLFIMWQALEIPILISDFFLYICNRVTWVTFTH